MAGRDGTRRARRGDGRLMRLLAIDTASAQCSAALSVDGHVHLRAVATAREHAQLLLPMIESLLAEAGLGFTALDAIAFGRGPGSFTGVRVAASVAQGLALGAGLPVVPVSDLRALALHGALEARVRSLPLPAAYRVAACLDARMSEVYAAAFDVTADVAPADAAEVVCAPADFRPQPCAIAIGPGFAAYPGALAPLIREAVLVLPDAEPSAREVALLGVADFRAGGGLDAGAALPVYLRDNVAKVPDLRP
jgi:tRNA threonylcarbamoyladenosine biosynthesis protein TsaB